MVFENIRSRPSLVAATAMPMLAAIMLSDVGCGVVTAAQASSGPLAVIDQAFRCPASIADPVARAAADDRFLRQVEAAVPRATPQQIATYHQALLRRHGCLEPTPLTQAASPSASSAGGVVRLTITASQSRRARTDADWVNMLPFTGTLRGQEDCDRPALRQQVPSLDGGFVYQRICRWVTSDDIIQVRVSDGRRREVTPGNTLAVLRNGPWRGMLLVAKHKYKEAGGSYDATWVVRPDGKEMFAVPGTDDGDDAQVQAWLRTNGWRAE